MASFRHFAWRFFVISSFCVAFFRYFVFSRGVFSLFRYFALRYFAISTFRVALFRYFAWRYFVAKSRKDEMAQISHHNFVHAQNFSTYADECIVRRGFVHRTQPERYVRSQYGNGSVSIR